MIIETLKFHASWCSPCKVLSKNLEGLEVTSIDVDEDVEGLASKFKIRSVPTLIFTKDGEEVGRSVGVISKQEYLEKIDSLWK